MDISDLCRCCMQPGSISIFNSLIEETTLSEIIEKYTGQYVSSEDKLPEWVCQLCFDNFVTWHSFVAKYSEVREQFSKVLELAIKGEQAEAEHRVVEDQLEHNCDNPVINVKLSVENEIKIDGVDISVNSRQNTHICKICNMDFNLLKGLQEHCRETGHWMLRRFECRQCSMRFSSKNRLWLHVRAHIKGKSHKCTLCDKKFSNASNFLKHKRTHTGEKRFFCNICQHGFTRKQSMIIHQSQHTSETPYMCEICGTGHKSPAAFLLHSRTNHGKIKCEICKQLIQSPRLNLHLKHEHQIGSDFLCNICGKTFLTKKSLEVHIYNHSKRHLNKCEICSKFFLNSAYLKVHMRIHSGERPYCCEVCGKSFNQQPHLRSHLQTHTGIKPFSCKFCNKAFAMKGNLVVHERIHTGETPYNCSVCNKGFLDSSSRKKHELGVHNK